MRGFGGIVVHMFKLTQQSNESCTVSRQDWLLFSDNTYVYIRNWIAVRCQFCQVVVYKRLIGVITAKTVTIVEIFPLRVYCALVLLMQTFKLTLN